MGDLKSRIKGSVTFVHYQDQSLVYRCDDGFEFPVPLSDTGHTRFPATEKAMLFMRWIRKHMEFLAKSQAEQSQ